jgi:hypothetical protein
MSKTSGEIIGLVGNNTVETPLKRAKPTTMFCALVAVNFKKFIVVDNRVDNVFYVVWFVWIVWNNLVQEIIQTVDRVVAWGQRSVFQVVLWQVAQQFADQQEPSFSSSAMK